MSRDLRLGLIDSEGNIQQMFRPVRCGLVPKLVLALDSAISDHVMASVTAPQYVKLMSMIPSHTHLVLSPLLSHTQCPFPCHFHFPTLLASNLTTDKTQIAQNCQHSSCVSPRGWQSRPKHPGLVG